MQQLRCVLLAFALAIFFGSRCVPVRGKRVRDSYDRSEFGSEFLTFALPVYSAVEVFFLFIVSGLLGY